MRADEPPTRLLLPRGRFSGSTGITVNQSLPSAPLAQETPPARDVPTFGSQPQRLIPPAIIPDHELIRPIGRGSYGEVWLARHQRLGTLRAVKIVRRDQFDHDRPFQREFEGIRRYEPISRGHPNLVAILHVGGTDECFFYVMELADDGSVAAEVTRLTSAGARVSSPAARVNENAPSATPTALQKLRAVAAEDSRGPKSEPPHVGSYEPRTLRSELKRHGALPIDRCLEIGLALAGALAHLHARGLMHRDVKPSNVIFVGGLAKLADIGLVAAVSDSRSFVGTEGYIPPEGPGTPSADCYALGKLLYELSTGHDRTAWPEPPADLPTRPDRERLLELNAILHKACAAEARQRYQSAEDMLAEWNCCSVANR